MEINGVLSANYCNIINKKSSMSLSDKEAKTLQNNIFKISASECLGNYNKAVIAHSNNAYDDIVDSTERIAEKIIAPDEHISRSYKKIINGQTVVRMQADKGISGFPDTYYNNIKITGYINKQNEI